MDYWYPTWYLTVATSLGCNAEEKPRGRPQDSPSFMVWIPDLQWGEQVWELGGRRGAARLVGGWEVAGGLGAWQPLPSLLQTVTTGGKFPETFQNSLWEVPLWCFEMRLLGHLLALAAASQDFHSDFPELHPLQLAHHSCKLRFLY